MGKKALVAHFCASGVTADVAGRLAKAIKISGKKNEILLTAEVIGTGIYDKAIIRRVGDFAQIQLKVRQWLDKLRVHKIRKVDR